VPLRGLPSAAPGSALVGPRWPAREGTRFLLRTSGSFLYLLRSCPLWCAFLLSSPSFYSKDPPSAMISEEEAQKGSPSTLYLLSGSGATWTHTNRGHSGLGPNKCRSRASERSDFKSMCASNPLHARRTAVSASMQPLEPEKMLVDAPVAGWLHLHFGGWSPQAPTTTTAREAINQPISAEAMRLTAPDMALHCICSPSQSHSAYHHAFFSARSRFARARPHPVAQH
jgi:hypothetical protein